MDKINIPTYHLPNTGVEIVVATIDDLSNKEHKIHRQSYYELILFNQGKCEQLIDFKQFNLAPNTIALISPNQAHSIGQEEGAEGLVLQFSVDCLATLSIDPYILNDICLIDLSEERFNEFYELALNIDQHSDYSLPSNKQISLHYLSILLLKLTSIAVEDLKILSSEDTVLFRKFSLFLEENFKDNRSIKAYEEYLEIPYKKLNAIVKRKTGKTVLQVIHDRLLLEIKRMLAHGQLSQKEISYQLNFDSTATFNQFVKKQTSCTPNEIKQRLIAI